MATWGKVADLGAGGVNGPASSTDGGLALWDGVGGDKLKDGPVLSLGGDGVMVYFNHGSNANADRPQVSGPVYWTGTVQPNNASAGDLWWEP